MDTPTKILSKNALIADIAAVLKVQRVTARAVTNAVFGRIQEELERGGIVEIRTFGTFRLRSKSRRVYSHPSGELYEVPAHCKPEFVPAVLLTRATLKVPPGSQFTTKPGKRGFSGKETWRKK